MNTETVIKALECCNEKHTCSECPYCNNCYDGKIIEMSLALIKEQQKELTYCYDKLTELEKECLGLSLHNINLKREKKYLEDRLKEEMEIKEDMSVEFTCVFGQPHKVSDCPITEEIDKAKAETVKRMRERLKQTYDREHIETGRRFVSLEIVDLVAKIMLEGINEVQE